MVTITLTLWAQVNTSHCSIHRTVYCITPEEELLGSWYNILIAETQVFYVILSGPYLTRKRSNFCKVTYKNYTVKACIADAMLDVLYNEFMNMLVRQYPSFWETWV